AAFVKVTGYVTEAERFGGRSCSASSSAPSSGRTGWTRSATTRPHGGRRSGHPALVEVTTGRRSTYGRLRADVDAVAVRFPGRPCSTPRAASAFQARDALAPQQPRRRPRRRQAP